jgi:hypothetical protein
MHGRHSDSPSFKTQGREMRRSPFGNACASPLKPQKRPNYFNTHPSLLQTVTLSDNQGKPFPITKRAGHLGKLRRVVHWQIGFFQICWRSKFRYHQTFCERRDSLLPLRSSSTCAVPHAACVVDGKAPRRSSRSRGAIFMA